MKDVNVLPILEDDLDGVSDFLNGHLNSNIFPGTWKQSFKMGWAEHIPNFGFQLVNNKEIVGVLCIIYSDQKINGNPEKFCNPHSWFVLDEYRNQSIKLVMAAVKQEGFHFTMFTPNPDVTEIFQYLKFKRLSEKQYVFINYPSFKRLFQNHIATSNLQEIEKVLTGYELKVFKDHRRLNWIQHFVFGHNNECCHVIYKTGTWKKIPFAYILYVSDPVIFLKYRWILAHYFLVSNFIFFIRIDARFFPGYDNPSFTFEYKQPKLFQSKTLVENQIQNIYSELVALDL